MDTVIIVVIVVVLLALCGVLLYAIMSTVVEIESKSGYDIPSSTFVIIMALIAWQPLVLLLIIIFKNEIITYLKQRVSEEDQEPNVP